MSPADGHRLDPVAEPDAAQGGRAERDPWLGRRVGRTKLTKLIATDARDRIYLATFYDGSSPEPLVVRLLGTGADRVRLLKRFAPVRERLQRLDHPAIARLIDVGATRSGRLYWVRQHVEGMRIDEDVAARTLRQVDRLRLLLRVCEAVAYAHAREVVHGAIVPASIVIDAQGRPHVLDFGLALLRAWQGDDVGASDPAERATAGEGVRPEWVAGAPVQLSDDARALGTLLESLCPRPPGGGAAVTSRDDPAGGPASVEEMVADIREWIAAEGDTDAPPAEDSVPREEDQPDGVMSDPPPPPAELPDEERAAETTRATLRAPSVRSPSVRGDRRHLAHRRGMVVAAIVALAGLGAAAALGLSSHRSRHASRDATANAAYARQVAAAQAALGGGQVAAARRELEETAEEMRGWEWQHLWSRLDRSLVSVRAHTAPITAVVFGAEDRLLVTCATDRTIRLWDVGSGTLVGSVGPVPTIPRALAVHPHLGWVAVGCDSGLVFVFDRDNRQRGRFEDPLRRDFIARAPRTGGSGRDTGPGGAAAANDASFLQPAVAFDPAGSKLVVGFGGGDVVLWEVPSLRRLTRWRLRRVEGRTALVFTPDGRRLAMGAAAGGGIRVWDLDSLAQARQVEAAEDAGQSLLAFGHDGETLTWVAPDGTIHARPLRRPQVVSSGAPSAGSRPVVAEGNRSLQPLAFAAATEMLYGVAAADSGTCLIAVEATTGEVRAKLIGHTAPIRAAAATADGGKIASADDDGTLKLWDARTQDVRCFHVPAAPGGRMQGMGTSADGSWIVAASAAATGRLCIWNVPRHETTMVDVGGDTATCVDVRPEVGFAVVGQSNGGIALLDFGSGAVRWSRRGHTASMRAVDIAASGRAFATGGDDATVLVWSVETRQPTQRLRGHVGAVLDVQYAPDGATLVSAAADGTLRIWDAESGRLLRVLRGHGGAVHAVAWAPDGKRLVSVGADGTLRLWDVGRDAPVATLLAGREPLLAVGITPDGTRIAAAGAAGLVHVLATRTQYEVALLPGHTGAITTLEFGGDGALVTASRDGTIRYWDTGRGVGGLEPVLAPLP